jgi:hypothetical protein
MEVLELFSGTTSFSKVCREREHKTFTVDFDSQFKPDLRIDIMKFDVDMLPEEFKKPDFIWASPPCTTFSVASIGKHWNKNKTPKSEEAKIGLQILDKTREIILKLKPKFWVIENPRGMMRNFLPSELRTTVTYCQYGDSRMKPTDLWNNFNFVGKKCRNGDKCHVSAPRGSKTGTQGIKGARARGIIPKKLCEEILNFVEVK